MTLWDIVGKVQKIKADLESGDYISALGDLADFITASQAKVGFPLPTSGTRTKPESMGLTRGGKKGNRKVTKEDTEEATVETLMAEIDSIDSGHHKRGRKVGSVGGFQDWAAFIAATLREFVNTWIKTHPPESPQSSPGDSKGGESDESKTTEES